MSEPGAPSAASADAVRRTPGQALLLLALLAAAWVQAPALVDSFRSGDDWLHLYQIVDHGFWWFSVTPHGSHLLTTSNIAFYLCHALFGLRAEAYYAVALLTHLLNVYLLFRLVEISCQRPLPAFLAALLWGTSGLSQAPIGWFSAYGHVLASTFVLWLFGDVARLGRDGRLLGARILARWLLLLLLAATSFGTGIGVALVAGPAAYLLMPGHPQRRRAALCLASTVLLMPALYAASTWIYTLLPIGADMSLARAASVLAPATWPHLLALLLLLVDYGTTSLLLGPLVAAEIDGVILGPFAGASVTALAWICGGFTLALLAACAWTLRRGSAPRRQRAIACALLAVGCYGSIAAGRAAFYAVLFSPLPLAAVQARYHYLGQALIAAALALSAAALRPRPLASRWLRASGLAAAVLFVALQRISSQMVEQMQPPEAGRWFEETVAWIRAEIAAHPPGSEVRIENRPFRGAGFVNTENFAGAASIFVIAFPGNEVDGRRVLFVESDPRIRHDLVERVPGTRLAALLVAPGPGDAHPPPAPEGGPRTRQRRHVAHPEGSS